VSQNSTPNAPTSIAKNADAIGRCIDRLEAAVRVLSTENERLRRLAPDRPLAVGFLPAGDPHSVQYADASGQPAGGF
jgi:hypothetical protein